MSDEFPKRSTSFAKTVDLGHEKNSLDRAPDVKDAFEKAKAQPEKSSEPERTERESLGSGSEMVRRDAPALTPKPPGPVRAAPDRQAANARLKEEKDSENQKLAAAKAALKEYKDRMANRGHDNDRDRQRDHGHER